MRQLYKAHAVLFVCAYIGLLGYRALTDPHAAALFSRNKQPQVVSVAPALDAGDRRPVDEKTLDEKIAGEKIRVADASDSTAAAADTARQQERARLGEVALQATRADEPQQRAEAIDQLTAATPETLQALQIVITSDSAARNRIRAVNSLGALAQEEGAQDAVMSILRLAMGDTNSSVASRANEIFRELSQRSGSAE